MTEDRQKTEDGVSDNASTREACASKNADVIFEKTQLVIRSTKRIEIL